MSFARLGQALANRKKSRQVPISVYLSAKIVAKLDKEAVRRRVSRNSVIGEALEAWASARLAVAPDPMRACACGHTRNAHGSPNCVLCSCAKFRAAPRR